MNLVAVIIATVLPLTAIADSPAPTDSNAAVASVIVMRGGESQVPPGHQENGVIVMRPPPGSFMRETTRLAKEAAARDERAALEAARQADLRLSETLRALEEAANGAERQQRMTSDYLVAPAFVRRGFAHRPARPGQHVAPAPMLRDHVLMNDIAAAF